MRSPCSAVAILACANMAAFTGMRFQQRCRHCGHPYLMGVGYDHFHRYTELEFMLAALLGLAATVVISLGHFRSTRHPLSPEPRCVI